MTLIRQALWLVVLLLFASAAWPQQQRIHGSVVLDDTTEVHPLGQRMAYFIDESGQMAIEEVIDHHRAGRFEPVARNRLALGFYPGATVWLHVDITNPDSDPDTRLLVAAENLITSSRVYQLPVNNLARDKPARDRLASNEALGTQARVMAFDNPWSRHLYPLSFEPHTSNAVLIAYQSQAALRFAPTLYTEKSWNAENASAGLKSGLYFGAMAMVLMLMTFRALRYRSKVDGYYLAYVGGLCASVFFTRGLHQMLGLEITSAQVDLAAYLSGLIALPAMVGFTRTFISWPRRRRNQVDQGLVALLVLFWLISGITWTTEPSHGFQFLNIATLVVILSLLSAGTWALIRGHANAKFFLLAFSPFLLAIFFRVLEGLGIMANNELGLDLYFVTSFLHAAMLSGAIVIRATSIKKAQDRLKDALDQAESDIQHQREWFQMLSHEIRTPISIIANHTQLAEKSLDPNAPSLSHIKKIDAGTKRLTSVVTQLLSIKKLSRSSAYTKRAFDFADLMHKLIANTQHQTQDHILTFESDLDGCQVHGDVNLMTIAIQNLLDNAIQYSPDGGGIVVRLSEKAPGLLTLQVSDEGVGMDAKALAHIFERHYRTKQVEGVIGSGLGLYLVRAIIEQHDGTITCRSVLGEGTTFEVDLPHASPR
jgi:signal transduction histidine kinase